MRERIAWALLAVGALVLRLVDLGGRAFQHDEAQVAYFSWLFAETGEYEYEPVLHGPLMYHATAAAFRLLGDGDAVARLPQALAGTGLVVACLLLRPLIGRGGALAAGIAFAIAPTALYYSRFAREDIIVALIELALLGVVGLMLERPRRELPVVLGVLLALGFTTKESTYITLAVLATFLAGCLVWRRRATWEALKAPGPVPWLLGFAGFWITYAVLFTTFGTNPGGLWDGLYEGPMYWRDQQPLNRGGEAWSFHLVLLATIELPLLVLGLAGLVLVLARPSPATALLAWAFAAQLAAYSWASERFAWLTLHPLVALVPLAGIAASALWRRGIPGRSLVAVALVATCASALWANTSGRIDPASLLVAPQTTAQAEAIRRELRALDSAVQARLDRPLSLNVDSTDGLAYPWAWYFRDADVGFLDMRAPGYTPDSDAVLISDRARPAVLPRLAGYRGRRFVLRAGWARDYGRLTPAAWWRYLVRREPWNATSGTAAWVYVRRDLDP